MESNANPHTHGIMFHHFHNEVHPCGQGSLSATQFSTMLDWLTERYSILNAPEYLHKLKRKTLAPQDICLTFDDALLCQAEIAAPILKKRGISAFFFTYTGHLDKTALPDPLEIFRYFRSTCFASIDEFYESFFIKARHLLHTEYERAYLSFTEQPYLEAFPFYTANDKWFRYLRDIVLGKIVYESIMSDLMSEREFFPDHVISQLWMNEHDLRNLASDGHIIGLHTHTHPTMLHQLDVETQEEEYQNNYDYLVGILKTRPIAMSHPCGHYTHETLKILERMGIEIGFRSNFSTRHINSPLEIPREDHANILKEMHRVT